MGWCHEFGTQITEGCDHPMRAAPDHCGCATCGVVCPGRFSGCGAVWALGPRSDAAGRPQVAVAPSVNTPTAALPAATPRLVDASAVPRPVEGRPEVGPSLEVALKELRTGLEALEREARRQRRAINALIESVSPDRLAALESEVRQQREAILVLSENASFERLSSMAGSLPERIASASAHALAGQLSTGQGRDLAVMADDLHGSLTAFQEVAAQLRRDMAELVSARQALAPEPKEASRPVANGTHGAPEPAAPARTAAAPVLPHPGGSLGDKVTALGARPEWKAVRDKLTGRREDGPGR